jgi:hypothetical protein
MADDVFTPTPAPAGTDVPGSAEVLYLRRALYVLRGTYFNPIEKAQTPLPPHRWVLAHSRALFSEGITADGRGVSTIYDTPQMATAPPNAEWELLLVPIYPGFADSDDYARFEEAWLDVDSNQWVHATEVRSSNSKNPYGRFHERRLMRLPLWSSKRKLEMGGGFAAAPPTAASFETKGIILTSEIQPFGTPSDPWEVEVDKGFFRTFVQLRFYDHQAKKEKPLPQGVLLRSFNSIGNKFLGGSSVRLDDGSIFMQHATTKDKLGANDYRFGAPFFGRFELATGKMGEAADVDAITYKTHRYLPERWCCLGFEGWVGNKDASADIRKPFNKIRKEGDSEGSPLCFLLDDLVLVKDDMMPTAEPSTRICLLDNLMRIRDQDSNGEGLVPWSKLEANFPLRGEEAVFVRGKGLEEMTRLIDYEGRLFEVGHEHSGGRPGGPSLVGGRAGAAPKHLTSGGRSDLALIDTRYCEVDYQGKTTKLAHAVVYTPCRIVAPPEDDQADGKNEARTKGVPILEHMLWISAQIWDQKHPAHDEHVQRPGPKKDYALVPENGLSGGCTQIKVRHHFGARTSELRLEVDKTSDDDVVQIKVHPWPGRATMGSEMNLFVKYGDDTKPAKQDPHPEVKRPYSFEYDKASAIPDRIDNVKEAEFVVAHELGHAFGLPDEYMERYRPGNGLAGMLPQFDVATFERQFHADFAGMMQGNHHPRLRYPWFVLDNLRFNLDRTSKTHWWHEEGPFMVQYVAGSRTMKYVLPEKAPAFSQRPHVYRHPVEDRVGECKVFLHHLGDDESARGCIIKNAPTIFDKPLDGCIVVACNFWFEFTASVGDAEDQWDAMYEQFGRIYYKRADMPHFIIEGPAGAKTFTKVGVLVRPRFEMAPNPSKLSTDASGNAVFQTKDKADIEVEVRGHGGTERLASFGAGAAVVKIRDSEVGHWLMRFAIDPDKHLTTKDNDPIKAADLDPVNAWVAKALGRGLGKVKSLD